MTPREWKERLRGGALNQRLARLYTAANTPEQVDRAQGALDEFAALFGGERPVRLFSAPGRTEIGGNHTDHQRGRVLAAAVDLDVLCVAGVNSDGMIRIQSQGHPRDELAVDSLEMREDEKNRAIALIRGVAARCRELGYEVGGFDAYTTSNVLKGSGLSSSAAFEVAVGTMISHLFNGGRISAVEIAQIGQYAENRYFGKPSGLMDQMASSVGGFVAIDFADPAKPLIDPVAFDLAAGGYTLCIVDTKGDHADLTHEYAAIPVEMGAVARFFGKEVLREVSPADFYGQLPQVRRACGDRAALRAMHFYADDDRVERQVRALRDENFATFLQLVIESGRSSQTCLQNVYACSDYRSQGLSLALAVSEQLLRGAGAWRVHGGGFAGTIQAFVPAALLERYTETMEKLFGPGSCYRLAIRPVGGVEIAE